MEEALRGAAKYWEEGDPTAPWEEITAEAIAQSEEMRAAGFEQKREPWPEGDTDTRRNLPLIKLTREGEKHFYGKDVIDVDIMAHLEALKEDKKKSAANSVSADQGAGAGGAVDAPAEE